MAGSETHYALPRPSFDEAPKVLIVVAPYYRDIADNLIAGAKARESSRHFEHSAASDVRSV